MKPIFYILPGFGEDLTGIGYKKIIEGVSKDYNVVEIKYNFNKRSGSFEDVLKSIEVQLEKNTSDARIFGFSFGALFAYQLSSKYKFKKVIIASISAILSDDLALYTQVDKDEIFSEAQQTELAAINYAKPLLNLEFFFGSKENKEVIERTRKLQAMYGGSLHEVRDAEHFLDEKYASAVLPYIA